MKEYKAYIFDIDITLLDTIDSSIKSYNKAFEVIGSKFDPSTIYKNLSMPLMDTYNNIENKNGSFEAFYNAFVDESLVSFIDSKFYDDSLRILKYLKDNNKKIGIVTNRELRNVLEITDKYNITSFFDSIITCDKVKHIKPDKEPVLKAIKELGLNKNECVYLGDALNDFKAASSANIDFIAVERYDNCKFKCDNKIHSFDELIK